MTRAAAALALALLAAGCGGGDDARRAASPAPSSENAGCQRDLAEMIRRQARDPSATRAERRSAREMLRALADDEFTSGCTTVTIPLTRTTP